MILVGEPHPELQLESLIRSLDLGLHVRVLGFRPIEEFVGYLAACDIVLNLRYPTVGENSGTLDARARPGQGGGGFRGGIVQRTSRHHLPESARGRERRGSSFRISQSAGEPARGAQGAGRAGARVGGDRVHLAPSRAALRGFSGANRGQWSRPGVQHRDTCAEPSRHAPRASRVEPEYILSWAPDEAAKGYIETHLTRFEKTLAITPPGGPDDRILEMGSYLQITPALETRLGYGEVRGCYYGPAGKWIIAA